VPSTLRQLQEQPEEQNTGSSGTFWQAPFCVPLH
jgi:hypothetical protein